VDAPEEVVALLERGGRLEGGDVAALGVDAGEDVADGAVLASGVQALKDDEKRLLLAGVEDFLEVGQLRRWLTRRAAAASGFLKWPVEPVESLDRRTRERGGIRWGDFSFMQRSLCGLDVE